jgi:hypothetical protein
MNQYRKAYAKKIKKNPNYNWEHEMDKKRNEKKK